MSIHSTFIGFNAFIHLENHIALKLGVLGFDKKVIPEDMKRRGFNQPNSDWIIQSLIS